MLSDKILACEVTIVALGISESLAKTIPVLPTGSVRDTTSAHIRSFSSGGTIADFALLDK
jgi:hypothetical protein